MREAITEKTEEEAAMHRGLNEENIIDRFLVKITRLVHAGADAWDRCEGDLAVAQAP